MLEHKACFDKSRIKFLVMVKKYWIIHIKALKKLRNLRMSCIILKKNIKVKFVKQIKNVIMPFRFEKELIIALLWLPQSIKSLIPIKKGWDWGGGRGVGEICEEITVEIQAFYIWGGILPERKKKGLKPGILLFHKA